MKYPVKTRIDDSNRDDIIMVQGLFGFLAELIGSKVILAEAIEIDEAIDNDYCEHCSYHREYCECQADRYERNIDYEYDNWVDRQMEES